MTFLRQSTAKTVSFGPFVNKTDGTTFLAGLVSSLDNGTTGIKLSKNGAALTIRHASVTASTYDTFGNYRVTIDTTDTNTLGTMKMQYGDTAVCLTVWDDFTILPSNVYDSLILGGGYLKTDIRWIAGDSVANKLVTGDSVANRVWDITKASHTISGTFGDLATKAEVAHAVRDEVIDKGYTLGQLTRLMAAALLGKVSGGGSSTITFRSIGDSINIITTTVDASGNRLTTTLSP
jgi:hypothetical protein